ncbi:MAG: hypothetical protein CMH83_11865 [Nocardioides sp.]|nr:hypothetical protein [Nocardioides sp.]
MLEQVSDERLAATAAARTAEARTVLERVTVGSAVDTEAVLALVRLMLGRAPASTVGSTVVATVADLLHDGPDLEVTLGELVARDVVERLVDEALGRLDDVERGLDGASRSPAVGTLASRFMGRVVTEVVQSNRAVAEKVPGFGSLVSFGASTAGRVIGAADKQLDGLFGDTASKGAAFAVRRLNKVLVDTLRDPVAREAVLEVYDLYADSPLQGLGTRADREEVHRVAGVVHDAVIGAAAGDPAAELVCAVVRGVLEVYAEEPLAVLLDDLDVDAEELTAHVTPLVVGAVRGLRDAGELERLAREELAPFFDSPAVLALLD